MDESPQQYRKFVTYNSCNEVNPLNKPLGRAEISLSSRYLIRKMFALRATIIQPPVYMFIYMCICSCSIGCINKLFLDIQTIRNENDRMSLFQVLDKNKMKCDARVFPNYSKDSMNIFSTSLFWG